MTNIFNKAHSTVRRPINNKTATKNNNFNKRVNTVSGKNVNIARPKAVVNAARPKIVLNAVKGNQVNAVKALACWFWKPKTKVLDHVSKHNSASITLNKFDYVDAQGRSKKPSLSFRRPFGCPVIILNTIDHLCKLNGKADEGFFVGYSINRSGSNWLFDIDALTKSMNYKPVDAGYQSNSNTGTKACDDACKASMETVPSKDYILLLLWPADPLFSQCSKSSPDAGFKPLSDDEKKVDGDPSKEDESNDQEKDDNVNSTNNVNTASDGNSTNNVNAVSSTVNVASIEVNDVGAKTSIELPDDPNMPELEDIVYSDNDEDVGAEADMNNLDAFMPVSPIPTTRIHKDHLVEQIIRDLNSAPQTRRMTKNLEEHGFEDPDFPDRVYKVEKALYGLHQAPRACTEFEKMMHKKFQMSYMGELTFFLELQVKQKEDGILISQDKYVIEILKKFGFTDVKTASTPMETQKPLLKDEDGEKVDCCLGQETINPKVSHLHAVKRIFRYSKGQPKLGLSYPKDSPFDLVAYTDSDYARASLDRKSTIGGCQFLRCRLISWQCKKQTVVANSTTEAEYVAASSCCGQSSNEKKLIQMIKIHTDKNVADFLTKAFDSGDQTLMLLDKLTAAEESNAAGMNLTAVKTINEEVQLQALMDGKNISITEATIRKDLQLEDVEEGFGNMKREGKGFSGRVTPLFPTMMVQAQQEQGEGLAIPTDPQHTHIITQPSSSQPQKKHKPRNPKKKDTQIPQSRLLMRRILKRRVKKLEKKQRSKTHGLKRLYKVGLSAKVISSEDEGLGEEDAYKQGRKIHDIDADEDITLENVHDEDMFGVNDLDGDEVVVESEVTDKDVNLSVDKVTLAQALAALKSAKVQEKGDVIKEPSVPVSVASTKVSTVIPTTVATTIIAVSSRPRVTGIVFHKQEQEQDQAPTPIVSSQQLSQIKVQDKGKGRMNEPEPVKKLSKNDQLRLDEELAFRLQAEEEVEERLAREKAQQIEEANTAWDDIQAKVEADYQLAQRLHNEEQKQYTDKDKAKFFCEFLDQRRKFFVAKRAKAKRNKPPTQAQQRKLYSTYLKNMEGYTLKQLKGFKFEVIKNMFDKAFKRQKLDEKVEAEVDDAKEVEELKQCLEIVPDDEDDVKVDATPLSVKMPIMLKNFDREDLEVLCRIVKARFKKTEPVNYMDTFLHLNLKTMFEHHLEDNVWKNQQGLVKVLN
ncbi:putative ribonuclease H-like domain-containing protein [Tanacetum coccineum]